MKKWDGYQHGINLGGWLSQCDHTKSRYDNFITKEDVKTVSTWGVDHVRVPVDYNLVQDGNGNFIEHGFSYIDSVIAWCEEFGLNMILDLHKTAGYSFDEGENEKGFFYDDELIKRFIDLWEEFAKRYSKYSDRLAFELLNEVVEERDNEPWMKIAEDAVKTIRKYSKDIKILIGSYMNNSAFTVKCIAMPFDENIVYNFHCYEPLVFTHQGAHWIKEMPLDLRLPYPVEKDTFYKEALRLAPGFGDIVNYCDGDSFGEKFFENVMAEAIKTAEERDVMLYCGEYGVIDRTNPEFVLNWYKDISAVFEKYGIGRAAWTYKEMDFGISDEWMAPVREQVIALL